MRHLHLLLAVVLAAPAPRPASSWAWSTMRNVAPRAFRAPGLPRRTFTLPQTLGARRGRLHSLSEQGSGTGGVGRAHDNSEIPVSIRYLGMCASGANTLGERAPGRFDVSTAVQCAVTVSQKCFIIRDCTEVHGKYTRPLTFQNFVRGSRSRRTMSRPKFSKVRALQPNIIC
jgi:hypothetical protein